VTFDAESDAVQTVCRPDPSRFAMSIAPGVFEVSRSEMNRPSGDHPSDPTPVPPSHLGARGRRGRLPPHRAQATRCDRNRLDPGGMGVMMT